jgi:hypothetical protein
VAAVVPCRGAVSIRSAQEKDMRNVTHLPPPPTPAPPLASKAFSGAWHLLRWRDVRAGELSELVAAVGACVGCWLRMSLRDAAKRVQIANIARHRRHGSAVYMLSPTPRSDSYSLCVLHTLVGAG